MVSNNMNRWFLAGVCVVGLTAAVAISVRAGDKEENEVKMKFADVPVAVLSSCVSPEEKRSIAAFRSTCLVPKPSNLDAFLIVGQRIKQMALERKASATTS